jgi:hypothetical protein
MSGIGSRATMGKIALSVAIALLALILTSFFDAAPNIGTEVGSTVSPNASAGGPWCGPHDAFGAPSCRYWTFEACLVAVTTSHGTCRPNPAAALVTDEGPYRTYRSLFRVERAAAALD